MQELGVEYVVFPATGTSEDVAMLLADDKGAELIVAVGTHETLVEFLDKGRSGMASTFLTRLRVGGKLIDAKGVSRLYEQRVSNGQVALLVLAGVVALLAALAVTPVGQGVLRPRARADRRRPVLVPQPVRRHLLARSAPRPRPHEDLL